MTTTRAVPQMFVESKDMDPEIKAYQEHQQTVARISAPEQSRTLLQLNTTATLCTISTAPATTGYPFGATVSYAVDEQGRAVTAMSSLSSHTRDLRADNRCSLHVTDLSYEGMDDARCCFAGRLVEVKDAAEIEKCSAVYKGTHPDHFWVDFGDFAFFRMDEIASVRLIGGFGQIATVPATEFWAAKPDPVAQYSKPVCGHMNKDHMDSILSMVKHYVGITVSEARMLSVDRLGVNIQARRGEESFKIRLPFEAEATNRKAIKDQIVHMTKASKQA